MNTTSIVKKFITPTKVCSILALAFLGTSAHAFFGFGYGGYGGYGRYGGGYYGGGYGGWGGGGCCVNRCVRHVRPVVVYRPVVRYVRYYTPRCNTCYNYSSCSSCGSGSYGYY